MNWFTLALIPPFFWAISNIVDSYISKNKERNIWQNFIIVNLSKFPFLLILGWALFWKWISIREDVLLWWMLLWGLYTIAVLIYLIILQKEEASIALPLYEIGPFWSILLGFIILSEIPSWYTLLWIFIIIFWGYILSREWWRKHQIQKSMFTIFWLVLISSLFFNITYILFKYAHWSISLYELFFFQYIFQALFSVILWVIVNKIQYKKNFSLWTKGIWTLSILWESMGIFWTFLIMFSYIDWPVGVVSAITSTQMIWVVFISFILSRFYPHYFSEGWDRDDKRKKIFGVLIIFIWILVLGYDNYV
jgi:drug/metabolite transporter (DMT)-like permease